MDGGGGGIPPSSGTLSALYLQMILSPQAENTETFETMTTVDQGMSVEEIEGKKMNQPLRVRALVMTISLDLPKQILNAQTEARKLENIKKEDVGGMLIENGAGYLVYGDLRIWRSSNTSGPELIKKTTKKNHSDQAKDASASDRFLHRRVRFELKRCHADEPLAVQLVDGRHLDDKLHFVEEPLEIVGREVKRLKQSRIPLVKVRWNYKRGLSYQERS
ncbi:hypothetical protein Tco_0008838 [Tanacetum coccineum]